MAILIWFLLVCGLFFVFGIVRYEKSLSGEAANLMMDDGDGGLSSDLMNAVKGALDPFGADGEPEELAAAVNEAMTYWLWGQKEDGWEQE